MAVPPLVWANGQPIERAVLKEEISAPSITGVRSIIAGHPASGLTPQRLASLLREAEGGNAQRYLELAEEMEEKDLHYQGVMGTRKRAVSQLPITVEPADESPQAKDDAKLIEDWIDRDTLEDEVFDMLDAVGKGFSATEIIWGLTDGLLLPDRLEWRDPRWFQFDLIDGNTLRLWTEEGLQPLQPAKFIVHKAKAKSGLPIRGGLARAVAWGWMFKNYGIKDWVAFLEMFGLPMRVGKYDPGTTEPDIRKLAQAVAQLGSDAAAVFPKTMDVEFIDGKQGAAPADLWRSLAEYIDDQVSKGVLGQTSSTDAKAGGLGSGQANLHGEVRGDIERADAKQLAATLNRDLVPPMIMLNRGPRAKYPRIKIGRPDPVDVEAMTKAASVLVPMGVKVSAEKMREAAGLPAPEDGEELLVAPSGAAPDGEALTPSGGKPPKTGAPSFLNPLKSTRGGNRPPVRSVASASNGEPPADASIDGDGIDSATEEALGDWEQLMSDLVEPIDAIFTSASSYADLRARLSSAIGVMDVEAFAELIGRTGFAARLAGDADLAGGR